MSTGIFIVMASVLLLAIATWIHSRHEDDDAGKIIWSLAQFACVIALLFGSYLVYMAIAAPPKQVIEGPGF
jgi:hypothetical protein